jgi:uncharacterized protein
MLAKRGAGKTYTAAVIVEGLLTAGLQVVVADPVGVWWGLRSSADGQQEGLPIVIIGGEHGDVPLEMGAGQIIADVIVDEGLSVVLDKGEQTRFMTEFAERLYHQNRQPLHLVLDEGIVKLMCLEVITRYKGRRGLLRLALMPPWPRALSN